MKVFVCELVGGVYVQYIFNLDNKFVLMVGFCGDYSSEYGFFVILCVYIKYNFNDFVYFCFFVGKGYCINYVFVENNYLMVSSCKVSIVDYFDQEEVWNYGVSILGYILFFGKMLNLNLEYYYIDFLKQVVVDMDMNLYEVVFYNFDGCLYLQVFQVEVIYFFFQGFLLIVVYCWIDVKIIYNY